MLQNPEEFQTPTHPAPPMPWLGADHPPPAETTTVAELGAAVAALPAMKDALQEAFDRLAACSPTPLPFAWVDLDAHVSELQSAISVRFRQVRALEGPRAAAALGETRGDGTGSNLLEEEEALVGEEKEEVLGVKEEVEEVVEVAAEEKVVEVAADEKVVEVEEFVEEEEEKGDEEMQEADNEEADDTIGKDGKDEEAREVLQEEEVEELALVDDRIWIGNSIKDDNEARRDEQYADKEMKVANEEMQSTKDGDKSSQDKEQDANMEEGKTNEGTNKAPQVEEDDANMEGKTTKGTNKAPQVEEEDANMEDEQDTDMEEALAKNVSAMQCKEEEACGVKQVGEEHLEAHKGEEVAKNAMLEETMVAKEMSLYQGCSLPGGSNDHTTACTKMDAQRLVKLLFTNSGLNLDLQTALHRAQDAAALALHLVELFLHDKMLKTNKAWVNCVGLIRMVPVVVTELSADTIELAKPVAKDWKEMIDNSENCTALGNLASWGFLYFIISYNIVAEFETKEIFRLFGTMPRKQQKMNYAMLFKGLRLTDRIPELMDYLIENGQQMDVLYWAHVFNLVDKYPAVSLLKGYIEKAKQTAIEISQKNMTSQSLSVVIKELDNLRRAQDLADQQVTDSSLSTSIREEISNLLGEFEKRKQSLAKRSLGKSCTTSTSKSQQQHTEGDKKQKKEEEHHEGQESQQQGQQSKPGEKLEKKLDKPQQKQKQKEEYKPHEKQQQSKKQQQNKKQHAKRPRQHTPMLPAQASPTAQNTPLRGHFGDPTYAAIPGVYHGYPAQPGGYCVPPFAQLGAHENIGSFNPFYPHLEFYP